MPWLEAQLTISQSQHAAVEQALETAGALSITLTDAEDHPVLEPAPGETPLWPNIVVNALFDAGQERAPIVEALIDSGSRIAPEQIQFRELEDQDWTRAWMDRYQPMQFGDRLWIYPSHIEAPDDPNLTIVKLDPGLAFGTGTHPTTALCLEWLSQQDLTGKLVLDYGCGSGVLAIAALKLGAARAIGIDNDPQALIASRDNAERNGVSDRLHVHLPDVAIPPCEVFVANILAGPLESLAPRFASLCLPGAPIVLSGILSGQEDDLIEAYILAGFRDLRVVTREGWVRIEGVRAHH